ncbi:hypothetical protein OIM90_01020 [Streptomyces sp. AD16]|nr:hypothetical protein OIM90_01020 [Streptomyces sp. AD16]
MELRAEGVGEVKGGCRRAVGEGVDEFAGEAGGGALGGAVVAELEEQVLVGVGGGQDAGVTRRPPGQSVSSGRGGSVRR